jgi:hypothetical protein
MITSSNTRQSADIDRICVPPPSTFVSDELGRLMSALHDSCGPEAVISFNYDGTLRVHIDVRDVADVARLEATLPSLCGGVFHDTQRGLAAHHSFFHRISAMVAR